MQLPSLTVEGFRGIRALELPSLGPVTLLAGKNGVGKTTVLEAIRVYASRGDSRNLLDLLGKREEFVLGDDLDGDATDFPDFASLFHDHDPVGGFDVSSTIRIHAGSVSSRLFLDLVESDVQLDMFGDDMSMKELRVGVGEQRRTIQLGQFGPMRNRRRPIKSQKGWTIQRPDFWPDPIVLESLGPGLLNNDEVSRLWDAVALTPAEEIVINALRLVLGDGLERIAVVGGRPGAFRSPERRAVAKLDYSSTPFPLKRLGDGAQRLFGISLALANCRNGILLIDEVENGIHYSIQPALRRMIFRAAEEGNVQVVAATHSWDCVASFAVAAAENPEEGTFYRLERFGDDLNAIQYNEEYLDVAAQQRIEVR